MKSMQKFYVEMFSSEEKTSKLDRRLPALTGFNKAKLVATSQGNEWYFWEAEHPTVTE